MTTWIEYTYPIRSTFDAKLILPADLTRDEIERLCAFIRALAPPTTPEDIDRQMRDMARRYRAMIDELGPGPGKEST